MEKRIAILIVISLFASLFISCGSESDIIVSNTSDSANNSAETSSIETEISDDLPEFNFKGEEFTIDTRPMDANSFINSTMDVESETGDVLNDAIYTRNRTIEERFNFKFNIINTPSADRYNTARNIIMAGDSSFDVFLLTDRNALLLAQEGMCHSFDTLPYINLSKPYWSKTLNDSISIAGKNYFAYGDFNLIPYDYTHMLLFNKKMISNLKLEDPYELVLNDEWTLDNYNTMAVAATRDLDGNTKFDDSDSYGLLSLSKQVLPGFWIGAGVQSISKDNEDIPVLNFARDKHFSDVIDKIFTLTYDNGSWYPNLSPTNFDQKNLEMFVSDKGLFTDATFFSITKLRGMDTDFGILPYPKWDAAQKSYLTRVEGGDFALVPVTSSEDRIEMAGVILEAMACESMKTVIPAYYEKVLKGKITRDTESEKMLDIIYNTRVYDLGDTYWCNQLRDGIFKSMFDTNDRNLSSKIASVEATVKVEIDKTVKAFIEKK